MDWLYAPLPLEPYWVSACRAFLALEFLIVLVVLQFVRASGYPNPTGRFAARAVRVGVGMLSFFYWALILGNVRALPLP